MQFAVTVALFAAVVMAAPAALAAREDTFFMRVERFHAYCDRQTSTCHYNFVLYNPSNIVGPRHHCGKILPMDADGLLPAVPDGGCHDSLRTWAVVKNGDGSLTFSGTTPWVRYTAYNTGHHTIPATDLVIDQNDAGPAQRYVGEQSFMLVG